MERSSLNPTPESYASDTPPDRMIGIEDEYDIQVPVTVKDCSAYITKEAMYKAGLTSLKYYMSNGAKLHKDLSHLEYCTPACRGPRQAAAADIAGIKVISDIVEASGVPHRGLYRLSGTSLRKINRESNSTSGVHENFMIARSMSENRLLSSLMLSHLASRIWATSGAVTDKGYRFSQKIPGIGETICHSIHTASRTMDGSKPMIIIPPISNDTDIFHTNDWARVEVRFADPLQSLEGQRTSLGATSLVLRLIEHQAMFKKDSNQDRFADSIVNSPLAAARLFMSDLSLKQTVEVASGNQQNALAIGEQLATMALELTEMIQLPADEVESAHTWLETIHALKRSNPLDAEYDQFLLRRFDMAAKHRYLARCEGLNSGSDEARGKSLLWDRVLPIGVGQLYWQKLQGEDDEVEELRLAPPKNTEAAHRAKYICEHHADIPQHSVNWVSGWQSLHKDRRFFSDPFGNKIEQG